MGKCWLVACGVKIAAAALLSVFQAGAENVVSSIRRTWVELNTTKTGERHVQPVSNKLAKIAWGSVRCGAAPFVQQILYGGCICEDDHGILAYLQLREVPTIYDQQFAREWNAHTENKPPYFLAHSVNLDNIKGDRYLILGR
jgi:hypothetical protein